MPKFECRLGTAAGDVVIKELVAPDERVLRGQLEEKGYFIFGIRPKSGFLAALQGASPAKRKVGSKEFIVFNQEFSALLKAGLPVLTALELLLSRKRNTFFEKLLEEVKEDVRSGASLSEAFANRGDVLPRIYPATIASGERSGELVTVIQRYLFYLKTAQDVKKKIASAVIYPAILLTLAAVLITVLMTFIVPKFAQLFMGAGAKLPLLTRLVLGVSKVFQYGWPLMLAVVIAAPLTVKAIASRPNGRLMLDRFYLRLPLFGINVRRYNIANMCRTLGTLVQGGIPVVTALDVVADALGNAFYRVGLQEAKRLVLEGQSLWSSLERTGTATPLAIEMIEVGESTGALAEMLDQVSRFYDDELTTAVERFIAMLEPALLVVMAVLVAIIVLSVYMPLFSMYNLVGG
ncbi:MAG: type II secretion system F family protein [Acidobacteria bacterium]|jgi:type IV pilus assembly protein PilC|nr:type II secretion system F family protein [Acidobacteriota bacterium]